MSIINNMLQDLDKRSGRPAGEAIAGDAIRSVKRESQWKIGRNTLVMLATFSAVVLGGLWWLQPGKPAPAVISAVAPALSAAPAPAVMPTPAVPPTPAVAQIEPQPTVVLAPPAPAEQAPAAAAAALPVQQAAVLPTPARAPKPALAPAPVKPTPAEKPPVRTAKLPAAAAAPALAPAPVLAQRPEAAAAATTETAATPAAAPRPAARVAATNAPAATGGKSYSPQQIAANQMGEAVALDRQGRQEEAKLPLQRSLAANPLDTSARQLLVRLNLDTGNLGAARSLLEEGHRLQPEQADFTLALARLRVESGDSAGALKLLEAGSASARNDPQYSALLATLLLRAQRYEESVQRYLVALRADPANSSWLIGVGVALEGAGKPADALEAYRRADSLANLSAEMARFVSDRLVRLSR